MLYISPALENDKDEYIDLMFGVSARGDWEPWLNFFFKKVCEACKDTITTIDRLLGLQDEYRLKAGGAMRSASAMKLVDILFERPAISVNQAAEALSMTYPAAKKNIDKLVELEILREVPEIYPRMFIASEIMRVASPQS